MSDTMLHGVLCMPPELWRDDELDKQQRYSRYLQASRRIEDMDREIETLRTKAARWDAIETLMILGDVELNQAEDGGYIIYVEPAENILPTGWDGATPDQVADKVVAQLVTPNAALCGPREAASQSNSD